MPKSSHGAPDRQNNHMISNFLWSSRKNEPAVNRSKRLKLIWSDV